MKTARMQKNMLLPDTALAIPGCSLAALAGLVGQGHSVCSVTAEENVHPGQHRQRHSPARNRKVPSQIQTSSLNNVFCVPGIGLKAKRMRLKDFLSVFSFCCFSIQKPPLKKSLRDREKKNCLNIIIPFLPDFFFWS